MKALPCNFSVNLRVFQNKKFIKKTKNPQNSKYVGHCYLFKSFKKDTEKHKVIFLKKKTCYKILICIDAEVQKQTPYKLLVELKLWDLNKHI